MGAKHTPGPWRVDPDYLTDVQNADGTVEIVSMWEPGVIGQTAAPVNPVPPRREAIANACLIAAAPCLLEALKLLADFAENAATQDYNEDRVLIWIAVVSSRARAAIARAEGRS